MIEAKSGSVVGVIFVYLQDSNTRHGYPSHLRTPVSYRWYSRRDTHTQYCTDHYIPPWTIPPNTLGTQLMYLHTGAAFQPGKSNPTKQTEHKRYVNTCS